MRTTPPTLLQLAAQSLLENPALAVSALEELPCDLFPLLFLEALNRRHMELLKAMVQAWPFPCLPLGPLLSRQDQEPLQMALDGLDMLLAQKDRPRRVQLQTLDLRKTRHSFWNVGPGAVPATSSPPPKRRRLASGMLHLGTRDKRPLVVIVEICFDPSFIKCPQQHLLQWARERRGQVELCCERLQIWDPCFCAAHEAQLHRLMDTLELGHVKVLEMNSPWNFNTLVKFSPFLGKMMNLQKLLLSPIYESRNMKEHLIELFVTQFSNLNFLQELYLNRVTFLQDYLHRIFRCLKTPLESLSITECQLSETDWMCLSLFPVTHQLKYLSLRGVTLTTCWPGFLQSLLEKVASTLEILDLEDCKMSDSLLTALLPALSRCTQLTKVCFYGSCITMPVLKNLMLHTAQMSQLNEELYPFPLESYESSTGTIHSERVSQHCGELMNTLRDLRQPKRILFRGNRYRFWKP
ncbi:PRAME family member 12-like [Perognathus longimembris pacificus]|uniref:PRAME family member 12-like n=1 Tax=Perognathus longimembris pacificus TaxID=214514 RepID=UPI0020194BB8|nr:PRAME family member 12-like [Perognathus longimembris pacificus]